MVYIIKQNKDHKQKNGEILMGKPHSICFQLFTVKSMCTRLL